MEGSIVVETKMTREDYVHFSWFSVLKKGRHVKPAFWFMAAAFLFALIIFAWMAAEYGFDYLMDTNGVFLLVVILFIPVYFLMLNVIFRSAYRRSANLLAPPARYEFTAESLVAEAQSQTVSSRGEYKYELFFRVFELRDALYLYANKLQGSSCPSGTSTRRRWNG